MLGSHAQVQHPLAAPGDEGGQASTAGRVVDDPDLDGRLGELVRQRASTSADGYGN